MYHFQNIPVPAAYFTIIKTCHLRYHLVDCSRLSQSESITTKPSKPTYQESSGHLWLTYCVSLKVTDGLKFQTDNVPHMQRISSRSSGCLQWPWTRHKWFISTYWWQTESFQNFKMFQVHPFHFRLKFFSCFFKEKDFILSWNLTPALKIWILKTFKFS